jgi:hypothetical protein
MNGYNLLRAWYNFKFDNPHKAKAKHSDFYCYLVDQWNRLGQKECFGLPTIHTMECLGVGSYNTYKRTLDDLIEFGFVKIIKDSRNQHHSKVIALSNIDKATDKPLDKATAKAPDEAPDEAIDTITKQRTKNKEQINNIPAWDEFLNYALEKKKNVCKTTLRLKYDAWVEAGWKKQVKGKEVKIQNWKSTLLNTLPYLKESLATNGGFQKLTF